MIEILAGGVSPPPRTLRLPFPSAPQRDLMWVGVALRSAGRDRATWEGTQGGFATGIAALRKGSVGIGFGMQSSRGADHSALDPSGVYTVGRRALRPAREVVVDAIVGHIAGPLISKKLMK